VRKFDQEGVQKFDRKCDRFEQKTMCEFVLEFVHHELYNASSEFDRHELKIGARFGHGTNQVRRRHIELVKRDSERFASHCRFHVELGRNDSHADSHVVRSNVFCVRRFVILHDKKNFLLSRGAADKHQSKYKKKHIEQCVSQRGNSQRGEDAPVEFQTS